MKKLFFLLLFPILAYGSYFGDAGFSVESSGNSSTAALVGGATFTGSGEQNGYDEVFCQIKTDAAGTMYFDFSIDGTNWDSTYPVSGYKISADIPEVHKAVKSGRYFRVRIVNGSSAQTYMRLKCYYGPYSELRSSANQELSPDNDATPVRTFAEPQIERQLGLRTGVVSDVKFGRNDDVDTSSAEDVWNGGGDYTGFNAAANEQLSAVSSDVDDTGQTLSSGTATGGSTTTLIDSGATFSTDGVAAGDALVNDTQGIHGIIVSVDSETQVTVHRMVGNANVDEENVSGDSYRVVNANDTGAALVRVSGILDANYIQQTPVYIVLNGTTTVTTSG